MTDTILIGGVPQTIGAPITVAGNQIFVDASIAGPGGLFVYTLAP
jgi:hypothetical protein